ncbi:hypothetical protein Rhopal_003573-T1 [Rhodotorula paludigena]|uniref:F-box domain-containing protein n=1 Tax=Rhodotorula paludigena TaxID=86838 RepID=A0AAV5GDW5_9BASI|nr:hypothetical protein Rhopal_003573-T1 [Rhodotorula paludigena]
MPDRAPAAGPSTARGALKVKPKLVGRLPEEAWIVVAQFLPIPDLPQLALCSRTVNRLVRDDRVWRAKLAWLNYKGSDEVDWRAKGKEPERSGADGAEAAGRKSLEPPRRRSIPPPPPGGATAEPRQSVDAAKRRSKPPVPVGEPEEEDEFGDFFDGEVPVRDVRRSSTATDAFGDFQDGDLGAEDPFGLAEDFGEVALNDPPSAVKKQKPPADDLLLTFDDSPAKPAPPSSTARRPPAVSRLTFDTPAASPASPSSSRPGAFAFNPSTPTPTSATFARTDSLLTVFKTHQSLLLPYYTSLKTHTTSSLVFTTTSLSPMQRARLLSSLARFCGPLVAPTRSLPQRLTVLRNVQSAMDFFESTLLAEFERADAAKDEATMKDRATVLWELNQSTTLSQVFVQKRETMFGTGHSPLRNLTKIETPSGGEADGIDFSAMDHWMQSILTVLSREGSLIARVFPPEADVLLYFLERIANDVVSDYITQLLSAAQPLQNPLFLLATAATFGQVYRLVEGVLAIEPRNERLVTKERAEDIVFRMFEPLMDDYLSEEGEWIRQVLEGICTEWDQKTASALAVSDPTFLASQNPAQVKKNVLAGFTKVLLLPVTIIPKTAIMGVNAITYGATGVIDTFAQLGTQLSGVPATSKPKLGAAGDRSSVVLDSAPADAPAPAPVVVAPDFDSTAAAWGGDASSRLSVDANGTVSLGDPSSIGAPLSSALSSPSAATATPRRTPGRFDRLQLLLSLDTALQLLQADRDSLKRIQTFIRYPGTYGRKVRDAIEEVFIVLLQVLGEKHVVPAFEKARRQMEAYRPEEHEGEEEGNVAPLVQFFELVHIGDTIQQMVDVYFEKEMAAFIDKKDFLNTVVREKKRFESSLDDAVAQGLNAAVNILMSQVEHLVTTRQDLRDFTPDDRADFDLQPTQACVEARQVLVQHCDMLKGSTDKHILEVFNQEVGIRLFGILLKHLKRQIISTQGGLRLIADLNAYHSFVTTLRQPQVTAYFTSLKMVGEIYLVDEPKDLGALVRDTGRYEGVLSPDDLYELVQRRADWTKIQRQVEKAVFGLKLADDCTIA